MSSGWPGRSMNDGTDMVVVVAVWCTTYGAMTARTRSLRCRSTRALQEMSVVGIIVLLVMTRDMIHTAPVHPHNAEPDSM